MHSRGRQMWLSMLLTPPLLLAVLFAIRVVTASPAGGIHIRWVAGVTAE